MALIPPHKRWICKWALSESLSTNTGMNFRMTTFSPLKTGVVMSRELLYVAAFVLDFLPVFTFSAFLLVYCIIFIICNIVLSSSLHELQKDTNTDLGHPAFSTVLQKHQVLMRGPLLIFLVPILSQFFERTESSTGQSPRSAFFFFGW